MGNLGSVVDEYAALDLRELPGPALGELLLELRTQVNRIEALYLAGLEVFDRSGAAGMERGSTQAWVRAELHRSPSTAARDVHLARDLADSLPATRAALAGGEVSAEHAQVIAGVCGKVPDESLAAAEPHMVEFARAWSPKDLRGIATHVIASYGRERLIHDEQADYEGRALYASATIGGTGVGNFTLHAAGFETLMTAIHAFSRPNPRDERTPAQRRADALLTMAEVALRAGDAPITGGVRPHVTVIATAPSLTGAAGAPGADYAYGATTSGEWARRFACHADIAQVLFSPTGEILDSGRATRTFTAAQLRAIVARDQHCIFYGCDAPAGWCDAHHGIHWADGGTTSVENGALLCGRHHDQVHLYGYAIVRTAHGPYRVDTRHGSYQHWTGHPPKRPPGTDQNRRS